MTRATPNCADVVWLFDPAVLVDDDGKAYLYFGGGVPEGREEMPNTGRVVQLGDDMISLAGIPQVVKVPWFFEAAFVNKIGDTYYYSYCTNWAPRPAGRDVPEQAVIAYMTSDNPMGPWEYRGTFFRNPGVFFGSYGNNHHSFVEFNGKWYFFYHTRLLESLMGITGGYRSTHVEEMTIRADGYPTGQRFIRRSQTKNPLTLTGKRGGDHGLERRDNRTGQGKKRPMARSYGGHGHDHRQLHRPGWTLADGPQELYG